jgi:hypothetical protein
VEEAVAVAVAVVVVVHISSRKGTIVTTQIKVVGGTKDIMTLGCETANITEAIL